MFKMINKAGHLTKTARDMFQGARIQGGANEMVVFPGAFADSYRMKRIAGLMDNINLCWYTFDDDMYVITRWFREAVADRSEAAVEELAGMIRNF